MRPRRSRVGWPPCAPRGSQCPGSVTDLTVLTAAFANWAYDCSLCVKRTTTCPKRLTDRALRGHGVHMFTQTLKPRLRDRVLRSSLVDLLTGPHGVDRYTELVEPTWTLGEARAKVVAVTRQTPRSVTLTLEPNDAFTGFRAGQHINLSVEIDGRRRTRCYSPASAEGAPFIEITVGLHDGGLVSTYLCNARVRRHGRRPRLRRRRLRPPRRPAAPDPLRLRRQRHHSR